ncbi:SDR family NAD(P)-dependent oxidoreductase [Winogradskya humida]|uniref:Oxidoreductase n=1 Tax=Winogradskya humida TaxID=113566 RepID=A0ABQ3ZYM4_9ACTN|nr:SDR family NAD(P)-dependent oxidoreductase [Actinoplanes humidus]GIE23695.1 oxidoreductase [Actinoplanes humidus]
MDGDAIEAALRVLGEVRDLDVDDPVRQRFQRAVDGLVKDGQKQRRADRRRRTAALDRAVVAGASTGAVDRAEGVPVVGGSDEGSGTTRRERRCYACRGRFRTVDAFYHALCPECAGLHRRYRDARTDLTGRRALVTGGRVKIGFQVALKLLRDGAEVMVVTRFPADAGRRFEGEPDAAAWLPRLRIIGADLRDPRQVLEVADRAGERHLDILINNAAQTVRRPAWAYQPLVATELLTARAAGAGGSVEAARGAGTGFAVEMVSGYRPGVAELMLPSITATAGRAGVDGATTARDETDATGALVVPGDRNSWTARLGEVDPVELLEVQLVNVIAPFLLLDRLRPALTGPGVDRRYVVNVTGREGWFSGGTGPERHPHTSMSKAALNMLTRVAAPDLARDGVHMCGVDTGWITDESPPGRRDRRAAAGWRPPLDVVDAAARVYHPILSGEAGAPLHGVLVKNYGVVPW